MHYDAMMQDNRFDRSGSRLRRLLITEYGTVNVSEYFGSWRVQRVFLDSIRCSILLRFPGLERIFQMPESLWPSTLAPSLGQCRDCGEAVS